MELTHYNLDATNALLRLRRERRIGWRAFGLGLAIASFVNRDAGEAWPSRATLEAISGIESRDIPRVTCELRDAGFMTIEERDGRSNVYRLTYGEIAACGDLAAVGKQPPTYGDLAAKPMGKQPPITMKEQTRNNETTTLSENDDFPTSEGDAKHTSEPQGNQTPSPTPSRSKSQSAKVTWDGARIIVPDAFMNSWGEAYPSVDLRMSIKRASSWCLSNPGKRPKKDFARFLNAWFRNVKPSDPEYIDPEEKAASDAELIRGAEMSFDDPDERADYWWRCKCRGEYVPRDVDCRPMPTEKEVAV